MEFECNMDHVRMKFMISNCAIFLQIFNNKLKIRITDMKCFYLILNVLVIILCDLKKTDYKYFIIYYTYKYSERIEVL